MGQWIAFSGSRPNAKISRVAAQMFLPLLAFGDQKESPNECKNPQETLTA
jgi:hypothetical protein